MPSYASFRKRDKIQRGLLPEVVDNKRILESARSEYSALTREYLPCDVYLQVPSREKTSLDLAARSIGYISSLVSIYPFPASFLL